MRSCFEWVVLAVLFLTACFLAFANGANDNFKGVASLYGSGTARFRTALVWGTCTTLLGSFAAIFLAGGLLRQFSGRGLVPDALAQSPGFLIPVALGAALTVLLATQLGFPISTTHALTGALTSAGLASRGSTVDFSALGANFLIPLLLGPVLAVAAGSGLFLALNAMRLAPDHRTRTLDAMHFLSAGAASFARGLNDTPKIAALLLAARGLDFHWGATAIAVTMAAGGLLDARRVAETLGKKVTAMNPGEGFAANLATAILVNLATFHSLPVSTTHVSVGSLAGIGMVTGKTKWDGVSQILCSWIITLPCAAILAAAIRAMMRLQD